MERGKLKVTAVLGLSALLLTCCVRILPVQEVPRISTKRLRELLVTSNVVVVDLRHNTRWSESPSRIEGAVRGDAKSISWAAAYPRDTFLVLYCDSGSDQTSTVQARKLMDRLYTDVWVLTGGWRAWSAAGFPVEPR